MGIKKFLQFIFLILNKINKHISLLTGFLIPAFQISHAYYLIVIFIFVLDSIE